MMTLPTRHEWTIVCAAMIVLFCAMMLASAKTAFPVPNPLIMLPVTLAICGLWRMSPLLIPIWVSLLLAMTWSFGGHIYPEYVALITVLAIVSIVRAYRGRRRSFEQQTEPPRTSSSGW